MVQPILKPGVLGPLPIDAGKILDTIETTVCSALQEKMNCQSLSLTSSSVIFPGITFVRLSAAGKESCVHNPIGGKPLLNVVYNHGYLIGFFAFHLRRLTGDCFELFLDLLPVHHLPPIGNVIGALFMVLEVVGVFPYIQTQNWQIAL